ncbi:MAG TPA: 50S ribosomal protein L11 methyltransferase, partial [Acidimicrobiales bacterium]|nr:50S ribosomal protein L11 methyltransferase [Acidimicrobiales bacterium]
EPVCVEVTVGPEAAGEAAAALWGLGATAVAEADDRLTAGFAGHHEAAAAAAALSERWPVAVVRVDDAWRDAWRPHARPVAVGRIWVRPDWVDAPPPPGAVELVLDPGRAYGDGSHPSTRLALEVVEARVRPGHRVLDVGCGSGVLAVAAGLLGAGPAVAIDLDPAAASVTASNARRNGVAVGVVAGTIDCLASTTAPAGPAYDLVVANLGGLQAAAGLLGTIGGRLAPGGVVAVSGLLADQADALVGVAGRLVVPPGPLVEVGRRRRGEWACVELARPPTVTHP